MPISGLEFRDFRRENYGKKPLQIWKSWQIPAGDVVVFVASLATRKTIDILPCFIVVSTIKWRV